MVRKWIGNATFADLDYYLGQGDLDDGEVKGFIVEKIIRVSVEKIKGKMALRIVQNGHITLKDCLVTEENRFANATI